MRSTWLMTVCVCAGLSSVALADDKPAGAKPAETKSDASAEIKVGTGVEKFEITGESATFPAGTTIFVWSRITNGEGTIKHVWKKDGKEVWSAPLAIGGKKWSTQSRRTIPKAGDWEVEVQTDSGTSLGSVKFSVQ